MTSARVASMVPRLKGSHPHCRKTPSLHQHTEASVNADTDQINLPEKHTSVLPWTGFWIDRSGWFWGLLLGVTLWKFLA